MLFEHPYPLDLLYVGYIPNHPGFHVLTRPNPGPLYHVVHVVRLDQYVLEVHSQCLRQTRHPDYGPILPRRILLHNTIPVIIRIPEATNRDTGSEKLDTLSLEGGY